MHVFALSDFREAVGPKWGRLGGLIQVAVESIARRHINLDNDIFTQLDTELSCLAIPNMPRHAARSCVAAIAKDIAGHLFGDATINGRRPQMLVANVALHDAVGQDGVLNFDAINAAVAKAGAALKPAETTSEQPPLSAPHRATLATLMDDGAAALSSLIAPEPEAQPAAPTKIMAISGGNTKKVYESAVAELPDWFEAQLAASEAVDSAASPAAAHSQMTGESKLTLLWSPTWVTAQKSVGAFHARVVRIDQPGETPLEGSNAYEAATPIEALTLDRFVATGAAQELKKLYFGQQRMGLTVPFHWMSLAPRWRDCLRIPLEDCPTQARRKFLKVEVFGLTQAIPPRILGVMFEPIAAMGCDVLARVPLGQENLMGHLRSVKAVGVDLADLASDDRVGDDELFLRLKHFRTAARDHRLACYVWSGRRRPLIARLIGEGFSLINGPGVMCDLSHPVLPTMAQRVA